MSDLLKFALVQRDDDFISRVAAAMLIHARYIHGTDVSVPSRDMGLYVEANPLVSIPEMVLSVAVNGTVIGNVDVARGVADASAVPDTDIQYVVGAEWEAVAEKAFPAS